MKSLHRLGIRGAASGRERCKSCFYQKLFFSVVELFLAIIAKARDFMKSYITKYILPAAYMIAFVAGYLLSFPSGVGQVFLRRLTLPWSQMIMACWSHPSWQWDQHAIKPIRKRVIIACIIKRTHLVHVRLYGTNTYNQEAITRNIKQVVWFGVDCSWKV